MPNFEEEESTVIPSTTSDDVCMTCDDSVKLTKSETTKEENLLDKVTTDETRDENKKQEKSSLHREVSVDALSSKIMIMLNFLKIVSNCNCCCRQFEVTLFDKTKFVERPNTNIQ